MAHFRACITAFTLLLSLSLSAQTKPKLAIKGLVDSYAKGTRPQKAFKGRDIQFFTLPSIVDGKEVYSGIFATGWGILDYPVFDNGGIPIRHRDKDYAYVYCFGTDNYNLETDHIEWVEPYIKELNKLGFKSYEEESVQWHRLESDSGEYYFEATYYKPYPTKDDVVYCNALEIVISLHKSFISIYFAWSGDGAEYKELKYKPTIPSIACY